MLCWKVCVNGLATGANLMVWVAAMDVRCRLCGALCEDDYHAILDFSVVWEL